MKMIPMICAVAMAALGTQAHEVVKIDLAGEWNVAGTNFSGRVKLPGTLADAGLGELQTPAHFAAYTERTSKTSSRSNTSTAVSPSIRARSR